MSSPPTIPTGRPIVRNTRSRPCKSGAPIISPIGRSAIARKASRCGASPKGWSMPPNDEAAIEVSTREFLYQSGASGGSARQAVIVETPINILFGGIGFAVMMATPEDLEDFAYGFSFTEGIIDRADD